ncbi:hypothetical protein M409DRAFT_19305 [Zasmidium cellare ATCC 36951]|uniref:Uncharacterized protein n=1 Tax=Zasmidium cellare ATCC 36951 TaxID=1080233 RepID=A0A6A6CTL0_ZASCE|nr:uncharacterized protein M409DRAFT_19305 [Zasmidium cellare ATCC 36951]KAF2170484.1 hypothetical protein M409DRAFT_19305 [Zasmidium cellare ATCC 36951]
MNTTRQFSISKETIKGATSWMNGSYGLDEPEFDVNVKLADLQEDPNNPFFSVDMPIIITATAKETSESVTSWIDGSYDDPKPLITLADLQEDPNNLFLVNQQVLSPSFGARAGQMTKMTRRTPFRCCEEGDGRDRDKS